jgi:Zn-dependent protease
VTWVETVPQFVFSILYLIKELLRIPFDILSGTRRRRYMMAFDVNAPKDVTWAVASANKIKLEGFPSLEVDTEPDTSRPGVFTGYYRMNDKQFHFAYRVLEERPGEAITLGVIQEESDRIFNYGQNWVCSVAIAGNEAASTLITSYDLTHTRLGTRLTVPLGLLQSTSRIKRTAEVRAGTWALSANTQIKNALITGALTFASFFAMFGMSAAAILIGLILIHEFGHVIAMRWLGIPVRGIYFVPFFGGVAIGDGAAKTEAARGLVAIMGPAFSVMTTVFFLAVPVEDKNGLPQQLAMMSTLLNGFNLLPMLPLDGGHIAQSLLSRFGGGVMHGFRILTGFAGISLALWIGDFVLLALLLLLTPAMMKQTDPAYRLPELTTTEFALLATAYAATIIFYGTVISKLWGIELP